MSTTKTTRNRSKPADGRSSAKNRVGAAHSPDVRYVHHPDFEAPKAAARFWGADRERIEVPPYLLPDEVDQVRSAAHRAGVSLSRRQEETLFLRYNYAKYRLNQLTPDSKQRDLWRRRAEAVREKLVHANLALVPAMAMRKPIEGVEFADKISEGYMAVLRCVECFDISRGYKFSTYACRGILSALYRLASKARTYRKYVPAQFQPSHERDDRVERRARSQQEDAVDRVRQVLRRNDADLDPAQRKVILKRYGLKDDRQAAPLWKIGRELGVSTERARQIEKRALDKLGRALAAC